jgi:hypothetical protein
VVADPVDTDRPLGISSHIVYIVIILPLSPLEPTVPLVLTNTLIKVDKYPEGPVLAV